MNRILPRFFLLTALALVCLSCATLTSPALGPVVQDESKEIAEQLAESGALVEDQALTAYVAAVGDRVAAQAESSPVEQFEFAVLDLAAPNAFSIPSGHVYVSRGLLPLLGSEDELAGLLGHEIGHVLEQHGLQQTAGALAVAPIRLVTQIGGGIVGLVLPRVGQVVTGTVEVPVALAGASYGRTQENEADDVGQTLSAAAGWDARALARVMDALAAQRALRGDDPSQISWFSTHPASTDRAARIRERAASVETGVARPVAADQAAFFAQLDGLVVGEGASGGIFDGSEFMHPGLSFKVRFPDGPGWKLVNTPQAVAAVREDPLAVVVLELIEPGDDALAVAQAFEPEKGELDGPPEAETVNGLATARATGRDGGGWTRPAVRGSARWVAHDGLVFRILCEAGEADYRRLARVFDAAERSFEPLSRADRGRILEDRLRIVEARAGEDLASLLERSESVWDVEEAAAANGVDPATPLRAGDLVKIARRERYESSR